MQATDADSMVFKPTLNITEQIAGHLAGMVINGTLAGGARIQELKIANELGVSRGSVREALLILERRHLIEIVPRKGAVVNKLTADEAFELVDLLSSIEQRWLHRVFADGQLKDILLGTGQTLLSMDRAAKNGSGEEMLQARGDFYAALLVPANRYMRGVFECLLPTSQRLVRLLLDKADVDLHDIARYYRALHNALETSDEERLDELLTAFYKRLRQLCGKTFADPVSTTASAWSGRSLALSARQA